MKIGYARVSSNNQDLELQKQALLDAGCSKIFSESVSGKDNNRRELSNMLESLRSGDIVVVYKIDRIARSLKGLIEICHFSKASSADYQRGVQQDNNNKIEAVCKKYLSCIFKLTIYCRAPNI